MGECLKYSSQWFMATSTLPWEYIYFPAANIQVHPPFSWIFLRLRFAGRSCVDAHRSPLVSREKFLLCWWALIIELSNCLLIESNANKIIICQICLFTSSILFLMDSLILVISLLPLCSPCLRGTFSPTFGQPSAVCWWIYESPCLALLASFLAWTSAYF